MSNNVFIDPFTQITTSIITSFTINCISLDLFKGAIFNVNMFDVDNKLIKRQMLNMDQATYNEWQSNDSFVTQWAATQLGFVLK